MEWPGSDLDLLTLRDSERAPSVACLFYQPLFRKENVGKCPFKELLLCAHSIPILLLLNQPPPSRFLESLYCIRDTLNTKDLGIFTLFRKVVNLSNPVPLRSGKESNQYVTEAIVSLSQCAPV